jgi:two-component system cell cycle response regulator
MAASNSQNSTPTPRDPHGCLSSAELTTRLEEEVNRAGRHRTPLSCLLVSLQDVEYLSSMHGAELPSQALAYLGVALGRELRRFDRVGHAAEGELLVVLPGADERRGEIVARRALGRLHAVKIESRGKRAPLRISVGIAAWREGLSANQLLAQTRLAAHRTGSLDAQSTSLPEPSASDAGELPALRRS